MIAKNTFVSLSKDGKTIEVSGYLTFQTVAELRKIGTQLAKEIKAPIFDLAKVSNCDSAALALLTAWRRDTKKMGKKACFSHISSQLQAIICLNDLDKVLMLQ